MRVFAIADLHLPGAGGKTMDVFGDHWRDHPDRIASDWDARVAADDVVLVPGDISWGLRLRDAEPDLEWLRRRPGTKIAIRGNHDYWWQSIGKVRAALGESGHAVQNDAWVAPDGSFAVAGTRLWDVPDLALGDIFAPSPRPDGVRRAPARSAEESARIFERELGRLDMSLAALPEGPRRVVMLHYPPTGVDLQPTPVTDRLERHRVDVCVFGHLHSLREGVRFGGERGGVRYVLTAADYLSFRLIEIPLEPV